MAYVAKKFTTGTVKPTIQNFTGATYTEKVSNALGGVKPVSITDPTVMGYKPTPKAKGFDILTPEQQKLQSLLDDPVYMSMIEPPTSKLSTTELADFDEPDYETVAFKEPKTNWFSKAMQTIGFEPAKRPEGYTVAEEVGDSLHYVGGKLAQGTYDVVGGLLDVISIGNIFSGSTRAGMKNSILKLSEKIGKNPEDIFQSEFGKAVIGSIVNEKDVFSSMARWSADRIGTNIDPLSPKISQVANLLGMVAQSAPQTGLMAIPVAGMFAYAGTALANNIDEYVKQERPWYEEYGYAFGSTGIDVASEMVFGLFAQSTSMFKGAAARQAAKMAKDQATPTAGRLLLSMLMSGVEEGAEELVAFPFQTLLDWRYFNPETPLDEFVTWETAKAMGQAGFVGLVSGMIFASGRTLPLIANQDRKTAVKYEKIANEIINHPVDPNNPLKQDAVLEAKTRELLDIVDKNIVPHLVSTMQKPAVEPFTTNIDGTPAERASQVIAQAATTDGSRIAVQSTMGEMQLGETTVQTETFTTNDGTLEIIRDSPYAPENYNSVYNFLVDESARGKGNGTALIKEAIKKYGNKLSAQTSNENSTRLFYNLGFRPRANINATLNESIDMFRENESLALIHNPEIAKLSESATLVSQSQREDATGKSGILPKGVMGKTTQKADAKRPEWKKNINIETDQRINLASQPNIDAGIVFAIRDKLKDFRKNVTLGSVPIPVQYAEIRKLFRESRAASFSDKGQAEQIIARIYNHVGDDSGKKELLTYAILFLDLEGDVQTGLYKRNMGDLFALKTPQEVLEIAKDIKNSLALPENSLVREALQIRKDLMNEVRTELIRVGKEAGIDLKRIASKEDYMYHAVLEYNELFNSALKAKGVQSKSALAYLKRSGSGKDYISDPIMADFLVLTRFLKDTARLKLYNEIKTLDISNTLPRNQYGDMIIKEGYSELDPGMFGISNAIQYSKNNAMSIKRASLQDRNIPLDSAKAKRELAKVAKQFEQHVLIVPTEIVDAVVHEYDYNEKAMGRFTKKLTNIWKYTKIRMPNAVIKYNARNMFGDLDPVIAVQPEALLKLPRAWKELFAYFYRGGTLTESLKDYVRRGGVTTGQTIQSLKTMDRSKLIKFYPKSNEPVDIAKRTAKKVWSIATLNTFTDFREQLLRYASYLTYEQELIKSPNGLPKYYGASIPLEIQNLRDIKDRAYKLANDLVGAYDDVSLLGQWAADHMMPFFRFKEVNVKRYYRMTKNIFYDDSSTMDSFAQSAISKAGKTARLGAVAIFRSAKLLAGLTAFYGGLTLANSLFAGDDDDELPEYVKNSPHITIPRWITGSERVYYIDRLGSLAELFDMFGMDKGLWSDLRDVSTGRKSESEVIKEMLMSPIMDSYNSSWPLVKIVTELISGKEFFPDPSNPRQIRDRWEYLFKQVGFGTEYKVLAGKPVDSGSYPKQKREILWNSVLPGDAALFDVYDMVGDYYNSIGESDTFVNYMNPNTDKYKRSQAAYYYKLSLKLEDWKAAEKYLAEYVGYGGTKKTLNSTMRYINPLNGMNNTKKSGFLQWITPDDKARLDKAMEWYKELLDLSIEPEKQVGLR